MNQKEIGLLDTFKIMTGPLAPAVLVVIGLAFRLVGILTNRLWYDEAYTVLLSQMPLFRMMDAIMGDVHPPLYYLFTWLLVHLGLEPLGALRGFSCVLSVAGLVVLYRLALAYDLPRPARLAALALMALSPFQIYYAQEARMYALLQLLVMLALWTIRRREWLFFPFLLALILYTHNYGLYYCAALGLVALAGEIRRPVLVPDGEDTREQSQSRAVLVSGAVAGAMFAPWAITLFWQASRVQASYWIRPFNLGAFGMGINNLLLGPIQYPKFQIPLLTACFVALLWVLVDALRARRLGLFTLAVLPCAFSVAVSILWQPTFLPRGLIGSMPALYLLAGLAYQRAARPGRLAAWGLAAAAVAFALLPWVGSNARGAVKEWGTLVDGAAIQPGDTVIHSTEFSYVEFLVYFPDANHLLMESGCTPPAGALTPETRAAIGIQSTAEIPRGPFYYVAMLTPLSTACHERAFQQIDAQTDRIMYFQNPVGYYGIARHE